MATDVTSAPTPDDHGLRDVELEKLRLEVQSLRAQIGWKGKLASLIPVITAVIAVAGFLVGVHQNNAAARRAQDHEVIERAKEFRQHFWREQLRLYTEASQLAASLATLPEGDLRNQAYRRFQQLYHGDLVVFEDLAVMEAMRDFQQNYIDYLSNPGLQVQLQKSARQLARTCRESASRQWNVNLETIDVTRY